MKEWLYRKYKAFLTWFGDIYFATKPPLVKAEHIRRLLLQVRIGDVICRGYNYYLDSYFIPGDYSHSGLVVGELAMMHSVAEGVVPIDIIDFIKDCDAFILLRPGLTDNETSKVVDRAFWHNHQNKTEYDFTFKDPNKFYCHEFTVDCLNYGGIEILPTEKDFGVWPLKFKRVLFLAQNLIDACSIEYEFNPEENK